MGMKKRILLTGASGVVGAETLKELVKRKDDYEIRVFDVANKNSKKILNKFKKDVEIYWGDITNLESVNQCAKDVDFIIHLAAIIPPLADRNVKLANKVNVTGTKNLINASEKYSPDAFMLYASSVSVYGDRVHQPWIKVDDPLKPSVGDFYAKTKIRAEQMVQKSKLEWSIFRFTGIMGFKMKLDPLFFHMPLDTSFEIATTRDTGFALAQALQHKSEIKSRIFNLSGGAECRTTYRKFLEKIFDIFGLGICDFPVGSFAERNFHCGFFLDCDELDNILGFQRDTLVNFYEMLANNTTEAQKFITNIFGKCIKKRLLKYSDPYQALKNNNKELIERFFSSKKSINATC